MTTSFYSRRDGASGTRKLSSHSRIGHVFLDTRRKVLLCLNDVARELVKEGLPITREDLERQPLQTLKGDPVTVNELPLLRAWRDRTAQETTFVLPRPGGRIHYLTWNAAPLDDPDGELLGITATVTVAPPELDWQELAGLAHDLRTPLQTLRLLVPLLESMPLLHPEAQEVLDRLRSTVDRALSVGLDLLECCRGPMQSNRRVDRAWFPLGPFLEALVGEHLAGAKRKGISLVTDLGAAGGWEVYTDRVRLGRLLSNLLSNAVRYTETGQVRFTAAWRAGETGPRQTLVVSVVDTGMGISAEDQESIFQPFERGKAGKESDSGGSGLGLAVVDRLVQELALTLDVFSEYGHGSTFDLLLPITSLRAAQS